MIPLNIPIWTKGLIKIPLLGLTWNPNPIISHSFALAWRNYTIIFVRQMSGNSRISKNTVIDITWTPISWLELKKTRNCKGKNATTASSTLFPSNQSNRHQKGEKYPKKTSEISREEKRVPQEKKLGAGREEAESKQIKSLNNSRVKRGTGQKMERNWEQRAGRREN